MTIPPIHRRRFLRLAAGAAGAAVLAARPGHAAAGRGADADRRFLTALVDGHIVPRVAALATATADHAARMTAFCDAPDAAGLEAARAGWHAAMDTWMGAQHLRPGPLLLEMRADRLAFWPERRNIAARQLGQLLAARDPAVPYPAAIARQSAAVQGLTALERLLFAEDAAPEAFVRGEEGRYRCALAAAIAGNVARLASEVRDGWASLRPALAAGGATPVGGTATEAVDNLYRSLVTASQVVADQKLPIPMGPSAAEAKPRLAESALAGRSLTNIALNLAAQRAMVLGEPGGAPGFADLLPDTAEGAVARRAVAGAFDRAQAAVAAAPVPFADALADPARRPSVEAALTAVKALHAALARTLPPLVDVTLGFNELDGD